MSSMGELKKMQCTSRSLQNKLQDNDESSDTYKQMFLKGELFCHPGVNSP